MQAFLVGYCLLLFLLIGTDLFIHSLIVVSTLRRHGHGPDTGWWSWNRNKELAEYKKICITEDKPLTWWKFLVNIQVILGVGVVGWFFLVCLMPFM